MSIHYHFVWGPEDQALKHLQSQKTRLTSAFDTSLISNGKPEVQET